MTRNRAETAAPQLTVRNQSGPTPASPPAAPTMNAADEKAEGAANGANKHLPSIRFIPHQDARAGRPSLQFPTISRILPDETAIIRVGRYSERDNIPEILPNVPSAAAVGFKSKVVSRKHCELWCKDGNWFVKDVKSSSGTFLNHIRLSQPNVESKPFRLKDGDIIQLGIDFRGGEEMIFRCVKIRVECNRGWQQSINTFNKQTHQRLRNLAKTRKESDTASMHTSECSICLMSIAPCQSLFVAPCSHVWHYKCIRPILNGATWPNFLCPNCRAVADLEADVEDMGDFEEWDDEVVQTNGEPATDGEQSQNDRHVTPRASTVPLNGQPSSSAEANGLSSLADLEAAISNINASASLNGIANGVAPAPSTPQRHTASAPPSSVTQPVAINVTSANERTGLSPLFQQTVDGLNPNHAPDCPMTPRNDAGPFVLDGSAGRGSGVRLRDTDSPSSSSSGAPTLPPLQMD
ncbi:FHA domain-containing protein [Massariosphaeria phaeospora]|uniref:RING-type E3 ubiquitin transferase n=1 Tax=Massariosphaeria phaeospora TaxID=100035 RepID=A0A7C8MEQ7_9PLEO|nr:FHA domain-containing protein [Massariosphaeria phaeospora]